MPNSVYLVIGKAKHITRGREDGGVSEYTLTAITSSCYYWDLITLDDWSRGLYVRIGRYD